MLAGESAESITPPNEQSATAIGATVGEIPYAIASKTVGVELTGKRETKTSEVNTENTTEAIPPAAQERTENPEHVEIVKTIVNEAHDKEKADLEAKYGKGFVGRANKWLNETKWGKVMSIGGKIVGGTTMAATAGFVTGGLAAPAYAMGAKMAINGLVEGIQYFGSKEESLRLELEQTRRGIDDSIKAKVNERLETMTDVEQKKLLIAEIRDQELAALKEKSDAFQKIQEKNALWRGVVSGVGTIGLGAFTGVPLGFQDLDGDGIANRVRASVAGFQWINDMGVHLTDAAQYVGPHVEGSSIGAVGEEASAGYRSFIQPNPASIAGLAVATWEVGRRTVNDVKGLLKINKDEKIAAEELAKITEEKKVLTDEEIKQTTEVYEKVPDSFSHKGVDYNFPNTGKEVRPSDSTEPLQTEEDVVPIDSTEEVIAEEVGTEANESTEELFVEDANAEIDPSESTERMAVDGEERAEDINLSEMIKDYNAARESGSMGDFLLKYPMDVLPDDAVRDLDYMKELLQNDLTVIKGDGTSIYYGLLNTDIDVIDPDKKDVLNDAFTIDPSLEGGASIENWEIKEPAIFEEDLNGIFIVKKKGIIGPKDEEVIPDESINEVIPIIDDEPSVDIEGNTNVQETVNLFNAAKKPRDFTELLESKGGHVGALNMMNAEDVIYRNATPQFNEATTGAAYCTVPIDGQENLYAVLHVKRNLSTDDVKTAGALFDGMAEALENKVYRNWTVEKPAIFQKTGNTWSLKEKGRINLGMPK